MADVPKTYYSMKELETEWGDMRRLATATMNLTRWIMSTFGTIVNVNPSPAQLMDLFHRDPDAFAVWTVRVMEQADKVIKELKSEPAPSPRLLAERRYMRIHSAIVHSANPSPEMWDELEAAKRAMEDAANG